MATARKATPASRQKIFMSNLRRQVEQNTADIEAYKAASEAPSFIRKSMSRPPTQFSNIASTSVAVLAILALS